MAKSKSKRKLIVVLGEKESGASVITSSLAGLNLHSGKSSKSVDLIKSFYSYSNETLHQFFLKTKKELNSNIEISLDSPLAPEILENIKSNFLSLLNKEFGKKKNILIFDEELNEILPFFKSLFEGIDSLDIFYVINSHKPHSYIKSIQSRPEKSLSNWIDLYLKIESQTRLSNSIWIDYNSFIKNSFDTIYNISQELKLGLSSNSKAYREYLDSLVLEGMHLTFVAAESAPIIQNLAEELYQILTNYKNSDTETIKAIESLRHRFFELATELSTVNAQLPSSKFRVQLSNGQGKHKWYEYDNSNESFIQVLNLDPRFSFDKLVIHPSSIPAYFRIDKIAINGSANIHFEKDHVLIEHGNLFVTDNYSSFNISLNEKTDSISLDVSIEFHALGNNVFKYLPDIQSRINAWIIQRHAEYENQIKELEDEALSFEYTIQSLTLHLEKHESLLDELSEYKKWWFKINREIAQESGDLNSAKVLIEENKKTVKLLSRANAKIDKLRAKISETEKDLLDYQSSKELNKKIIALSEANLKLEFLQEKYSETKSKLKASENSITSLKSKLKAKSKKIDKLKEVILERRFENEKLAYQVQLNFEKIDELNDNIKFLNEQNESIIKESYQFLEESKQKTYLLEEKNETIEQIQQEFIEEANKKNFTIQEKEQELDRLNSKLSDLQNKVEHAEKEKIELLGNTEPTDKVKELIRQKEQTIEELYNDINQISEESRIYKEELQNRESEIEELRDSISFRLGAGLTSPLRWAYDKSTGNKPINQSKLWLLQQMFKTGVKNPGKAVKSLNPKNLKTLSNALKNEPPHLIAENLNRLIEDREDENLNRIPEANEQRQKVLYISPNLPDFDNSSGGRRATRMLELLAEEFQVYAFTLGSQPEKYVNKLNELGVVVLQTRNYHRIKKKIPNFSAIIYAWYYTYFDAHKFTELYPSAKVILDSVDVHWVREERSLGIWEDITEEDVLRNKKREIEAYSNADVIWAVTENDKDNILKELPNSDIRVVSNIHEIHRDSYSDSNNNNMLFFGGFNHYPNISAAKMIAHDILPQVRSYIKDAKLIIAGANAPDEIKALGSIEGVEFKGFIEEDQLDNLYDNSFAAVAPLLAGAGIKGKICEAVAYRLPVFTNSIGNEGIEMESEHDGFISDEMGELASLLVKAMNREYDLDKITANAQIKLKQLVGPEGVKRNMVSSIMPEVSICIVTWNRLDLVKRCIESIEGNTRYPYFKILVHSNGCTDGTQDYLKAASELNPRIIPILSPDNEVFVKPNNAMMQMFPNNDVVLVNNDVYVTDGWLTSLINAAYSDTNIGIAGSKILYPDETLQEFGSELYEDGTGRNIGKWDDPDKDEYKRMKRVGYVSGCSMYIKRSTINQIGVFDEQFHPCYCEDSDLCYTAWENGIETVVTPQSIIYHDEGGTSGTDEESGFKAYQKVNFEKFLNKHKKNLSGIQKTIDSLN